MNEHGGVLLLHNMKPKFQVTTVKAVACFKKRSHSFLQKNHNQKVSFLSFALVLQIGVLEPTFIFPTDEDAEKTRNANSSILKYTAL